MIYIQFGNNMDKNIKGQWNKLTKWQKYRLTGYAIKKYWKTYWYYKKVFLCMNKENN